MRSIKSDEIVLQVTGLHLSFGSNEVLKGISLSVPRGGILAVIGPSGSGKSTLLRCMNLLNSPNAGSVRVLDQKVEFTRHWQRKYPDAAQAQFRAKTGMVFQHFNLFPHKTVLENVMEGPVVVLKVPAAEAEQKARALLQKVGLSDKCNDYPGRLSGGQKQRVAIARALAMEPAVMLFDEATSALDPELVGEVLNVIRALASEGMTMVIVTHEISFARQVADRVIFMSGGHIVEEGPARELIDNPQRVETQTFLAHFKGSQL
jgi:polar amino acid transport system ATP-binding protein